jgi:hypothetical protein
LDGAVISGLTLPAPISEDVHIRVPNLSGFLYDGSEIISVDADEIFGSVGIGTTSGAGADGIGSQSATGSLLASKTGAVGIDIAPLASGSSYILGGSTVFGPLTPGSLSLAGDPAFADRGLIQVYINRQGQSEVAYRVQKFPDGTDPLDLGFAEIVDISDSHVTTLAGFDLVFDGTSLSWADGEPVVPVVSETHRLFCSDYSGWIDVKIASAPGAAGQDKYKVLASKKNAGGLLLGHAFWDGAAISPLTDKRYFGNIAGSDFTDSTKSDLRADVVELRSNMVYSGGAVTFGIPGIGISEVRVSGPLVAYVDGRRFEVTLAFGTDNVNSGKGGYGGLAMPFASNFLYVDSSGVFQVASAWPAGDHARIAEVTVASGTVSGVVDARLARFAFTETDILEWNPDSSTLSVLASGSPSSSRVVAGSVNAVSVGLGSLPPGQLRIGTDTNTSSVEIGRAGSVTEIVGSLSQASGDFNLSGDAVSTIKTTNSLSPLGIITEGATSDIVIAAEDPTSSVSIESAKQINITASDFTHISDILVMGDPPPGYEQGVYFGPRAGFPNQIRSIAGSSNNSNLMNGPPWFFHPPKKAYWEKKTFVVDVDDVTDEFVQVAFLDTAAAPSTGGPAGGTGTVFFSGGRPSTTLGDPPFGIAFAADFSWTINDVKTPLGPGNFTGVIVKKADASASPIPIAIEASGLGTFISISLKIPALSSAIGRVILQLTYDSSWMFH